MSAFTKLKASFDINWTTILVGWNGLGVFSPWPDRWDEFPPLLSADELAAYADERLASSSDVAEENLILQLTLLNLRTESRGTIRDLLMCLSDLSGCDSSCEVRKWRVILLEDLLENIPSDPLHGLIALTEFWQNFGFPPDSPHEVQGKGNTVNPADYYQESNYQRAVSRHKAWIEQEKAELCVR
jgi:hypothetical protein